MAGRRKKRVVVIGGGTGTYQVLVGLKKNKNLDISAVIAMSDSGGSTGRLRQEFGMFPPGDLRRALLALSSLPINEKTLERLFDFRFESGKELKGHSLGNIFLAALTQITGTPEKAIAEAHKILAVSGHVLPVTLDDTHLVAILEDGTEVFGETNIDVRSIKPEVPIKEVFLRPQAKIFPQAREALVRADLIILGPGDLYTSIIPSLLVEEVTDAIAKSGAKVVFVINIMTKPGETDGYTSSRFVETIRKYLGEARNKLSYVVINKGSNLGKSLSWYKKFEAEPVRDDTNGVIDFAVIRRDFVKNGAEKPHFIRHDPDKLARTLVGLL